MGSYLVFDEVHLFPVDETGSGALATTLQMLQMLKGVTPFVLMTATFSSEMIKRLAELLDAESVTLMESEILKLPSQRNKRWVYSYRAETLSAEPVISDLLAHDRNRVIAICNTVDRAQTLTRELRADPRLQGVAVELLHSRFYSSDRGKKEQLIRCEFGEDRTVTASKPMILVAN